MCWYLSQGRRPVSVAEHLEQDLLHKICTGFITLLKSLGEKHGGNASGHESFLTTDIWTLRSNPRYI